jgi:superfamily II DNA or RNA helicase
MIVLRPYQDKGIADIRSLFQKGYRKVCYVAPTASGKTVLFCHLAHKITAAGQRIAVIVHRQELVDQTCKALTAEGLEFGIIAAGYPEQPNAPVLVTMAQTLVNRLDRLTGIAYLIVDEAHHVVAGTWRAILASTPSARVLGVTATPERLDGAGLREAFEVVEHRAVAQRIEDMNELHDAPPAGAPMIFMARLTQDLGDEFEPAARANAFANAMIAVTSERQRFRFQGRRLALCIDEVAHRQFHDAYGPLLSTRSIDRPSGGSSMSAK